MAQVDQTSEELAAADLDKGEGSSLSDVAGAQGILEPELAAKIQALRSKIQLSMGQITLAIMNLPRYRHQTLADLGHIIVNPLLRDRLAIAHKGVVAADGTAEVDQDTVAGIAIWASVSDEVDAKITEQVKAGAFPTRLQPDDWVSGEQIWLLDIIAGDRAAATSVLANFRNVVGNRTVKIHPVVTRLVDNEILNKLRNPEIV